MSLSTALLRRECRRKTKSETLLKPRVLYVGGTLPTRSETFVYREVFGLRAIGVEVVVASVHPPERNLGEVRLDTLAAEAIPIYGLGSLRLMLDASVEGLMRLRSSTRVLWRCLGDALFDDVSTLTRRVKVVWQGMAGLALARRVRHMGISHIHVHMAHMPTTIGMYGAMQLGVPFSFTGHGVDVFPERTLLKTKLRRAAFVACISAWHRALYKTLVDLPDSRLPIVRCAVDPTEFTPEKGPKDANLRVFAVGRLVKKKGFDVLITALARLVERGMDVQCSIAGDGPQHAQLECLINELGLGDRVRLLGAIPNRQVRDLLRSQDLFVLPCRVEPTGDRDGIPVVLMEAMASGVCVISSDLPTIRELVRPALTGMMVEPGSISSLVEAMEHALSRPSLRARFAAAGRRWVVSEFNLSTNVMRMAQAIETVTLPLLRPVGGGHAQASVDDRRIAPTSSA
jgi:colanic acid/amylovoran biosynthesis glycosyltransferase